MPVVKRPVSTSFWEDDKVVDTFTPEDKYFMLYLLTNPHTKQIGIYPLNLKVAAFETGYSVESVAHLLERFENVHGIIKRSKTSTEIAIKNFLCHSIVKGGKPVLDCLNSEVKTVKDFVLLRYVISNLSKRNDLTDTVKSFVDEIQKKYRHIYTDDNDNDNDNDNENESTFDVREPYEKRTEKKPRKRVSRTAYGEYGWVKLSEEEHTHLINKYGETEVQRAIDYVDELAQSNGNKYKWKDWNLVVRKCIRDGWGANGGKNGTHDVQRNYEPCKLNVTRL